MFGPFNIFPGLIKLLLLDQVSTAKKIRLSCIRVLLNRPVKPLARFNARQVRASFRNLPKQFKGKDLLSVLVDQIAQNLKGFIVFSLTHQGNSQILAKVAVRIFIDKPPGN